VRDVLAHCGAALTRVITPELNEIDVAERREWPLPELLRELADGYLRAGPVIGAAGGRLDVIALGEWLHGGDVRAALGESLAYASDGFDDACVLLGDWTRRRQSRWRRSACPSARCGSGSPRPAARGPAWSPAVPR
jgi:hypothetical protein